MRRENEELLRAQARGQEREKSRAGREQAREGARARREGCFDMI